MKTVSKAVLVPYDLWERTKARAERESEPPPREETTERDPYAVEKAHEDPAPSPRRAEDPISLLIDQFPPSYRRKAKALLLYLGGVSGLAWTASGELVIEGKRVPRSNVVDLVKHASRNHKTFRPPATEEFYRKLAESNAPLCLVESEEGRRLLQRTESVRRKNWISL